MVALFPQQQNMWPLELGGGGWKYPGAWMLSRSLEGETRTRDQPVSRLAKLVPCGSLGSQSLLLAREEQSPRSWERNRYVPIHPCWVLPTQLPQGTETLAAEEGGSSSQDKDIQVDRAARKALRSQESTRARMVSREHPRGRAGALPGEGGGG